VKQTLDKQSRFAFSSEKRREAEAKVAELSRFQVAPISTTDSSFLVICESHFHGKGLG